MNALPVVLGVRINYSTCMYLISSPYLLILVIMFVKKFCMYFLSFFCTVLIVDISSNIWTFKLQMAGSIWNLNSTKYNYAILMSPSFGLDCACNSY